jgi:hypothetical protein
MVSAPSVLAVLISDYFARDVLRFGTPTTLCPVSSVINQNAVEQHIVTVDY